VLCCDQDLAKKSTSVIGGGMDGMEGYMDTPMAGFMGGTTGGVMGAMGGGMGYICVE
jgi:hypothetical protein